MKKISLEKLIILIKIYMWLKLWLKLLFNKKIYVRYLIKTMIQIDIGNKMI